MPPIGEYQDDDHRALGEQNALHLHHHFHFHMALGEDEGESPGDDDRDGNDEEHAAPCPLCDAGEADDRDNDGGIHITLHIDTGGPQQKEQDRPQVGMLPSQQMKAQQILRDLDPDLLRGLSPYHLPSSPPPPPGPPGQPIFQLQNGENGGLSPLFARYSGVRAASANGEHGEDLLLLLCFEPTPGTVQQHIPQPAILLNEAGAAHLLLLLQRWIQDGKGIASSQSDEGGGGGEPT